MAAKSTDRKVRMEQNRFYWRAEGVQVVMPIAKITAPSQEDLRSDRQAGQDRLLMLER